MVQVHWRTIPLDVIILLRYSQYTLITQGLNEECHQPSYVSQIRFRFMRHVTRGRFRDGFLAENCRRANAEVWVSIMRRGSVATATGGFVAGHPPRVAAIVAAEMAEVCGCGGVADWMNIIALKPGSSPSTIAFRDGPPPPLKRWRMGGGGAVEEA
jgi:hypothetical protein